jgi:hypothetical protein
VIDRADRASVGAGRFLHAKALRAATDRHICHASHMVIARTKWERKPVRIGHVGHGELTKPGSDRGLAMPPSPLMG